MVVCFCGVWGVLYEWCLVGTMTPYLSLEAKLNFQMLIVTFLPTHQASSCLCESHMSPSRCSPERQSCIHCPCMPLFSSTHMSSSLTLLIPSLPIIFQPIRNLPMIVDPIISHNPPSAPTPNAA